MENTTQTPIRVIVTGATGMVGEGVLHECLRHPEVREVLIVNRKPADISHPKLKEIIHGDFFDISLLEPQLAGYDACLFLLGCIVRRHEGSRVPPHDSTTSRCTWPKP